MLNATSPVFLFTAGDYLPQDFRTAWIVFCFVYTHLQMFKGTKLIHPDIPVSFRHLSGMDKMLDWTYIEAPVFRLMMRTRGTTKGSALDATRVHPSGTCISSG
eukprot:GHVU01079832.1.p1 GENE.GHVU01079832.1~~GHVU01079832.1.p1  ORF type:complete len:103 (+),score=1.95 GHVU01079832.1:77-385(+)